MTGADGKLVVLYDGRCPLCTFQTRLLTWLDWFRVSRMVPFDHAEAAPYTQGIDPADLSAAIHCVTKHGRIVRGARALRHLCLRMPLLFLVGVLLWVPGIIYIAEFFYAIVSRNRLSLSRVFGCQGACAIIQPKQRSGDVFEEAGSGSSS